MTRPNVVFIIADQHRWDFLGSEDGGQTHTPALDRLARIDPNTQPYQSRGEYRPVR